MVSGISGMAGKELAQMAAAAQRSTANASQGDHDGDRDDGGPAQAGPDTDGPVPSASQSGVAGSMFHAIA